MRTSDQPQDDLGLTDDDLVARLQAGDWDAAIGPLDARYGKRLFHFLNGMVRDSHLAQDLVQEVFEKLLLKSELYRQGTNFRAWLFEIARNQALSALRTRQRLPRPLSSLPSHEGSEADSLLETVQAAADPRAMEEEEFMAAFHAAVAALPEHYKTVFELCVRQGLAYQDAGARLGIPTGTVAIRIMRARKRLFSVLQHHLGRLRRPPACFQ